MNPFLIAFITGLTTGGLSCTAMQGSLLASSLAHQIEQDLLDRAESESKKPGKPLKVHIALPILLFLSSKVVAYTVLGLLLGALGTVLTLTPRMRAFLLIVIGIFMIGNALRMFNIHPIFEFFDVKPPLFITRAIRRRSKMGADFFTPLLLGAMTLLIPCGVTQAMMAVAVASGDPFQGAGVMMAFTLGTSPVFFSLAYLTTRIGARLEKLFSRFVAVVILVLGIFTFVSGMRLNGFSLSLPVANILPGRLQSATPSQQLFQPNSTPLPTTTNAIESSTEQAVISSTEGAIPSLSTQAMGASPSTGTTTSSEMEAIPSPTVEIVTTLTLEARNNGYFPGTLFTLAGAPTQLNIVTDKTRSCAIAFVIPMLNYQVLLPETGTTTIDIPAQPPGTVMAFTCSMGMYTGEIISQ
jgi:uncharacterized protein